MAVLRMTLAQIITEILHITGYDSSVNAPWETEANLIRKINMTAQKIAQRSTDILRAEGMMSKDGVVHFDMWRATIDSTASAGAGNLVVTAGTSTGDLPADYDHWISFYDLTHERFFYPITQFHQERYRRLRREPAGPTKAIEIYEFSGSNWQRQFRLLPDVESGVTPSIRMYYHRLPAIMPGSDTSAEYPDGDYKFHYLWVLETVLELLRIDDPAYNRYQEEESRIIRQLVATARAA